MYRLGRNRGQNGFRKLKVETVVEDDKVRKSLILL